MEADLDCCSTTCEFVTTADVFTDPPGFEAIALHRASNGLAYTQVAVYDYSGTVLDTLWWDGHLVAAFWCDDLGLIVCVGVNSERTWEDLGSAAGPSSVHPMVVCAFEPENGRSGSRLGLGPDSEVHPRWCFAVTPSWASNTFQWSPNAIERPPPSLRDSTQLRINLGLKGAEAELSWVILRDGSAAPLPVSDSYAASDGPPASDLSLVPLSEWRPN